MKNDKKLSVIVPVYNVEQYLGACIESIIRQTYRNMEILLVNDGSTDDSGRICRFYEERDQRIRVIDKPNGGLSDARNRGLDEANGEFVAFIDSDDLIHPEMMERLMTAALQFGADIAVCGYEEIEESASEGKVEKPEERNTLLWDREEALRQMLYSRSNEMVIAWNKVYKRELFNGLRYPVGKLHEDEFVTYRLIAESRRVVCTDMKLYYYRQRSGSIMHIPFGEKNLAVAKARRERYLFLKGEGLEELADRAYYLYMRTLQICHFRYRDRAGRKELETEFRKSYREEKTRRKSLSTSEKMLLFLMMLSPGFSDLAEQMKKEKKG